MSKHELVTRTSARPTAKVLAGWITGAGATAVIGVIVAVSDSVPADTFWGSLAVAFLTSVASWVKKSHVADLEV